jgi:ABC-2 type transport system ATP-binding protein
MNNESGNILEIKNLKKEYKNFTLKDVTFNLPYGYIMGLIGPNGAGKTTIIKLIMNLIAKNEGIVEVFGKDNIKDEVEIKSKIGFVYDIPPFYEHLNLTQNKYIVSQFYSNWNEELFREYINRFDLDLSSKFKILSRGMKMKFQLAIALSHNADFIILDEPTSGLDPIFRRELLGIFSELIQSEKKSILFSTHITSDLERIADFITFINDGEIIFSEEKDIILETWGVVKGSNDILNEDLESLLYGIKKHEFGFEALTSNIREVASVNKTDLKIEKPTLEDIMFFISSSNGTGSRQ